MHYTVYHITNSVNKKTYIGAHKSSTLDDGYMGSSDLLKAAYKKYGIHNFEKEIRFIFDNSKDMYAKEAELVNEEYVARKDTYNVKVGGFGGWDHVHSSKTDWSKIQKAAYTKGTKVATTRKANLEFVRLLKEDSNFKKEISKKRSKEIKAQIAAKGHPCLGRKRYWCNNGNTERLVQSLDAIPLGWTKGRKSKTI